MERSKRKCKVCGKEYPYCTTELKIGEIFRWQDVACCPEHGTEYFAQVRAARAKTQTPPAVETVDTNVDFIDDEIEEEELDEEDEEEDFEDE